MEKVLKTYRYKFFTKRDISFLVFSVFSFFIGQAIFFTFANPFFAPFLSLFIGQSNFIFSIILIPLLLGVSLYFNGAFLYTYIFIGILMFAFNVYVNLEKIKPTNKMRHVVCTGSILLGGMIPVFLYSMSSYFFTYFLMLSFISSFITKMLIDGFTIFTLQKNIENVKVNEIIGFSLIISSVLLGVANLNQDYFNFFLFSVIFLTLSVSYSSMKTSTVTFAFIVSIVPFITNKIDTNEMIIILLISFSTLFAFEKDKRFIVLSVLPSLLISYLYIDESFFVQKNILALSSSILTFLVIPENFYKKLQSKYGLVDNNFYPYANKMKEFSSLALLRYSRTFSNLSKILSGVAKSEEVLATNDYASVFNCTLSRVCKDCKSYNSCFVDNTYTIQNSIRLIIKALNTNDDTLFEQQFFTFSKICLKSEEFIKTLNIYYEHLLDNAKWKNSLIEQKLLVSEQLKEISSVFMNIKEELSNTIEFYPKFEKQILSTLSTYNIYPRTVIAMKNYNNTQNVFITLDINIEEIQAFKIITKICSDTLGKKMKIVNTVYNELGNYEITLEEVENFDINFGVSFKKKNEVSGDSYSTIRLNGRKALLAISDGMGSGKEASVASTLALNLLEEFLESGFDINVAIKLINSSLILNNTKDSFATIDSIIIDLYEGMAQFIKIGAVQSFILRDDFAISINSKSLPIGIVNDIETQVYKKQLKHNDYVILLSDGVLDVISSYENQERWIKTVLKEFKGRSAKSLSDYILAESLKLSNGTVKDDMTVVVGKVVQLQD